MTAKGMKWWLITFAVVVGGVSADDANRPATLSADLGRIPPDVLAFVTVRPADWWGGEVGQVFHRSLTRHAPDALEQLEKWLGLAPADMERLTLVVEEARPEATPYFLVAAVKPLDRAAFLAKTTPAAKEESVNGHTLYLADRDRAFHFLGDRAYVLTDPPTLRELLGRASRSKAGPLTEALRLAAGRHTLVAAVNPKLLAGQLPADAIPPQMAAFRVFLQAQTVTLALDVGRETKGLLRVEFARREDARAGETAARGALGLAQVGWKLALKELVAREPGTADLVRLLRPVEMALQQAGPVQKGNAVEVAAELTLDWAAADKVVAFAAARVRDVRTRGRAQNNLRQLGIAFHRYVDATGSLPPAAVYGPDGKPQLSWRVLLLAYLDQDKLYKEFRLDEPWDSEHNKKLLAKLPPHFAAPGQDRATAAGETYYQVFTGKGTPFESKKGALFPASFPDGTSNTLLVVEAAKPVPWTKPEDLPYDADKPLPKFGGLFADGRFNAAFADGSVRSLRNNLKPEILRLLITCADGMPLPADFDK